MHTFTVLAVAISLNGLYAEDGALTITGEAPGNLFVEGEPIQFAVSVDSLSYAVTDHAGRKVSTGQARGRKLRLDPLPCGYYELECSAGQTKGKASFGVLAKPTANKAGRIAPDLAAAWLCTPDQWPAVAKMLRRAGLTWVRERFSWGQVQPREGGDFQWGKYDTVPRLLAKQRVNVYQIFHDSPSWTHPSDGKTRNPDDLRTVYRFAKAAGAHFASCIQAWEVWNEADIEFWPDLADRFAGVQKAAYLGFKAGAPGGTVLLVSLCQKPAAFACNLFDCGIADYYDVFNFHIYNTPANYPRIIADYLKLATDHQAGTRPAWLTEAGIRLLAKDGELSKSDEARQAEFIPASLVMSLASGVDRHFVFVMPYYVENGVQFGLLHKDLSPRPAMIALAVAANVLGEAKYVGCCPALPRGVEAHVFDTGEKTVAVIWSDRPQTVDLPVGASEVEVINLVGARSRRESVAGRLRLDVGRAAQYVVGITELGKVGLTHVPRRAGVVPTNHPCPVVARGYAKQLAIKKHTDCYVLSSTDAVNYEVEVCNFDEKAAHPVALQLDLPKGWSAKPARWDGRLEPMGRQVIAAKVRPGLPDLGQAKVTLTGQTDGQPIAPSVSAFTYDLASITPTGVRTLCQNGVAAWRQNVSANGSMEIAAGEEGAVRFTIRFTKPGDRWAYPWVRFDPPVNLGAYFGIAFEYRCDVDDQNTKVRLQLIEPNGSAYLCGSDFKATREWHRVVVPFSDLTHGDWSPPDANGRFDPDGVAQLMIGSNTPRDAVALEVRNIQAVGFAEPGRPRPGRHEAGTHR
jgi:hypothetical protein